MTRNSALRVSPYLASPLVSPQWLADHLGSDGLVVVDATVRGGAMPGGSVPGGSVPVAGGSGVGGSGFAGVVSIGRGPVWLSGRDAHFAGDRIPGALFADLLDGFSNPDGAHVFSRPDAERFQASVRALGIDAESTVIVYDGAAGQWAARLWWLFRSFGHERVAVLDGGLGAWRDEERPVESGSPRASVAQVADATPPTVGDDLSDEDEGEEFAPFVAVEQPGYWVDKAHVQSVVTGSRSALLLCALSGSDFRGETGLQTRPGHIPGSLNIPATGLFDSDRARWLKPAVLRERFGRVLNALAPPVGSRRSAVPAESPRVITYCNQGIAASATAFALAVIGETDVAVYDGSLEEWSADVHAPLETSAA